MIDREKLFSCLVSDYSSDSITENSGQVDRFASNFFLSEFSAPLVFLSASSFLCFSVWNAPTKSIIDAKWKSHSRLSAPSALVFASFLRFWLPLLLAFRQTSLALLLNNQWRFTRLINYDFPPRNDSDQLFKTIDRTPMGNEPICTFYSCSVLCSSWLWTPLMSACFRSLDFERVLISRRFMTVAECFWLLGMDATPKLIGSWKTNQSELQSMAKMNTQMHVKWKAT